ncbi:MAG: chemotaxis-specific protein-glutamate methyltransferase CheB [Actinobacteria bacterium]|nr:chemotaxis-specific protein-glutamate methyltransferase CheB [Actinomycetota bacterium]
MGGNGIAGGSERIRVLIADDSLVAREMLTQILLSDEGIEVVGTASNGQEAVDMVARLRPDLVTMDVHMPKMDGLEATERIMAYTPTPILVVSSSVYGEGMGRAFDALAIGALEVIKKPEPRDWAALEVIGRDIIRRVKILARVKVITHIRGRRSPGHGPQPTHVKPTAGAGRLQLVAVGSSTGGPSALLNVLGRLPADFRLPIVIAQHIAEGFVPGLASWLDAGCKINVVPAEDGKSVVPGTAYIAATGANLEIDGVTTRFTDPKAGQLYIPSADTLFESAVRSYGRRAIGVLLTGMGADGASGLKRMHDAGAPTICQDEATSTVWGMPKAAIDAGAADAVLPVHEIGPEIERIADAV